uniref:Ovule protein n=1 Tax=Heterorhabditis bacteriophora TaxID=37862 RepID=A0A1I7W6X1_HETBA
MYNCTSSIYPMLNLICYNNRYLFLFSSRLLLSVLTVAHSKRLLFSEYGTTEGNGTRKVKHSIFNVMSLSIVSSTVCIFQITCL